MANDHLLKHLVVDGIHNQGQMVSTIRATNRILTHNFNLFTLLNEAKSLIRQTTQCNVSADTIIL